jgi:hypothetical protein
MMLSNKTKMYTTLAALWFGIVFFTLLFLAFDRPAYFELVNASVVAISVGVVVGFSKGAWTVARTDPRCQTAGDVLVMGVFLVWIGLAFAFVMLWGYRLTEDRWWIDAWPAALSRWIILLGGVFHLAAAGAIDGKVPPRAYVRAGVIVGLAVAAALFLISFGWD